MKYLFSTIIFIALTSSSIIKDIDFDEMGWPREIKFKKGIVTIYQPQIESFDKNKIEARAAIAIKPNDKSIVFGAMWYSSRVITDKDEHLVTFDEIVIETLKFPEGDDDQISKIKKGLSEKLSGLSMTMSLERFTSSIAHLKGDDKHDDKYNNISPDIYYEISPAVLVFIDGDPILKEIENSNFMYVLNTPYFLVQNPKDKKYFLKGGEWWYSSNEIEKNWKSIDSPPKEVSDLAEKAFKGDENDVDSISIQLDKAPKLLITTKPAELIQTDGEPKFEPVSGTELLFLTNSESDIIMDISSQTYFILIAGRWYKSKQLGVNKWEYVSSDELPADFEKIPEDSDISDVRFSIPGTQESKDALLENTIPQTAEIDRKTATVEVQYDGDPKFKKIESTSVSYAENSDKTVLLINKKYYCVDDAVWFISSKASGPWEVCVEVPEEVQEIPPSSPVYNVKYVYIYDSTPEVVYVAYTPGYYGSYAYHGTVIYGTGYWYHPWYAHYYYPRPVTYGFGIHYNPWTGWGFSYGMSYGWISFGYHSYYRGWWGPHGYRYGYRHGYGHGYGHGYRHGYNAGRRAGYVAGRRPSTLPAAQSNIYKNRANGVKNTGVRPSTRPSNPSTRPTTRPSNPNTRPSTKPSIPNTRPSTKPASPSVGGRPTTKPAQPKTRENNIYSDKSGNVYKRDNSGSWQQRSNGQWNKSSGTRPSQPGNQLNRDYNSRNRGNQRANSYSNRGRSSMQRSRPSGGGRRR